MSELPAISLDAPYPHLIALGAKTYETRSRPCPPKHIGQRVAFCSTLRRPPLMHLPPPARGRGHATREHDLMTWLVIDTITDPEYTGLQPQGRRVPLRAKTPTLFWPHGLKPWDSTLGTSATEQGTALYLPLGAVVVTAVIAASLPIVGPDADTSKACVYVDGDNLRVIRPVTHAAHGWKIERIPDQLPFGDFTPGRFAWELVDVEPVDPPVPHKGRQGWHTAVLP